ncbi:MAG: LamG domain-containing protein, partial [Phycisphaerales bacterium]
MGKQLATVILCAFVASVMGVPIVYAGDPTLVGWWKCNEGVGTTARDSSGYGNDGVFTGDPQWVVGRFGGALEFDGANDYLNCGSDPSLDLTVWTITFWLNAVQNKDYNGFVIKGLDAAENYEVLGFADGSIHLPITFSDGTRTFVNTAAGTIVVGQWTHFAYIYDSLEGRRVYKDGALVFDDTESGTPQPSTDPLTIGNERPLTRFVNGAMDDVRIYSRVLTPEELSDVMLGKGPDAALADKPSPADEATDVLRDTPLDWEPGESAATHDVYFGTVFEDVNNASVSDPRGVLVSRDQADAAFDPEGLLEYGQTYYWRIDEINAAPDYTIFKGETWSFTTEMYAYPITSLTVEASTQQITSPATRTIDGSGLDELDRHGTDLKTMWVTPGGLPAWIQ